MQIVPEPEAPPKNNTSKIAAGVGLTAVAGVLLYFLLAVQPGVEQPMPAETVTTATEPEAISTPEPEVSDSVETVIDTIPEAKNSEAPVQVTPDLTPDPAPMAEAKPAETIMVETDALTTEISVSPDTADSAEEIPEPIAEVSPPVETAVVDPVAAPTPPVTVSPVTTISAPRDETNIYNLDTIPSQVAGIRGNSWYRSQTRTAYTLQLISASTIENIIDLLEKNPGNNAELSGYVKYTPSGNPHYLLFYGSYRDKEEGAAAVANLPAGLQAVNPWPRSIGNITDEIDTVVLPPR